MKIEVGKAYRTRGGWKAVVKEHTDPQSNLPYPLVVDHDDNGGLISHSLEGRFWNDADRDANRNSKADYDLIAEWSDEPAGVEVQTKTTSHTTLAVGDAPAVKFRAGDKAWINIDEGMAKTLNHNGACRVALDSIIEHTPASFDWADVKPGMAFLLNGRRLLHYVGPAFWTNGNYKHAFSDPNDSDTYSVYITCDNADNDRFVRAPEHDIEVK